MKSLSILLTLLILCFGAMQVFAQENNEKAGEIRIEAKSDTTTDKTLYFAVPVYRKIQDSLVRGREGFSLSTSSVTCELNFIIRAVAEEQETAIVTFFIATKDSAKNHSVTKKIRLKRGERKSFFFKPKIKCLNVQRYSVTAIY
jgi:hypothetical protein